MTHATFACYRSGATIQKGDTARRTTDHMLVEARFAGHLSGAVGTITEVAADGSVKLAVDGKEFYANPHVLELVSREGQEEKVYTGIRYVCGNIPRQFDVVVRVEDHHSDRGRANGYVKNAVGVVLEVDARGTVSTRLDGYLITRAGSASMYRLGSRKDANAIRSRGPVSKACTPVPGHPDYIDRAECFKLGKTVVIGPVLDPVMAAGAVVRSKAEVRNAARQRVRVAAEAYNEAVREYEVAAAELSKAQHDLKQTAMAEHVINDTAEFLNPLPSLRELPK
ncbi:hypothetical protein [Stenotrophomonas phage BUCT603B1]|nr:hypothetical protein [Stenotrophomonas phage BUCT603B1]HDS1001997.1 hypothetical protein [Stenotrophomonas maltophilia]